jgi:transcription initiation factor TFIIIB Brf1 subunit/transcription initiation factor TFIIB
MRCPQCGFREEDDVLVCSRCGHVFKETGEVLSEEKEKEVKAQKAATGKRNAIIAASAVVVVLLGGFGVYKLIVGPPVQLVGAWTNSGYGGLLALLSGGIKLQVTAQHGGVIEGTLTDNNITQTITKGRVSGKHVMVTTKGANTYIYYTLQGTEDSQGELDVVVTEYNTDVTPVDKTSTSATLVKASSSP